MSKENVVAARYAQALLSSLSTEAQFDQAFSDISDLANTFEESDDLSRVILSPLYKKAVKLKILSALLEKANYLSEVKNLAMLLLKEERFSMIASITASYKEVLNLKLLRAVATVEIAQELSSSNKEELEGKLKALSGKTLEVNYIVNGDLLGGFVAKIGHEIWDYSIKGQLEDMGSKILNMRVS